MMTSIPISASLRGSGNPCAHSCNTPLLMAKSINSSVSSSLAVAMWTISPNSMASRTASPLRANQLDGIHCCTSWEQGSLFARVVNLSATE